MKKTIVLVGLLMGAMSLGATELADRIAAKFRITGQDDWYGCRRTVFDFDGYEAWVVEPPEGVAPATGNPWTWTMQWATAYVKRTSVPRLVKERGWRHATVITYKHRMDATGLEVSARFQKYLVDELGFAKKANLIGMSWGGFFSTRYAVTYPENVAKLWLDAPLLCFWDFDPKKEKTQSGYGPWAQMAPADGKWSNDPRMPLNMAERLAATRIPVYLVYGGQDKSCPPELNAIPFIERFKSAGGEDRLTVLYREYFGHHPHGVDVDDDTIIDYFCNRKEKDMRTAFERLSATVAGGERTATFLHVSGKAEQPWLKGVPECAVVEFTLRPTSESEIHCRLFLPPPAKWNGRFWGIGNTALGDSLDPLHVEALHLPRLREGAATCEADMGTANGRHGREVVRDFGWRSHHLMCVEAKKMIAEFYGRPAKKNYFYGVSSGGGQGLHEAQRFPEDYDGIVCYVPAHYRTRLAELGRADYREGKRRDRKGFMNRVLNGPEAKNEYDMDDVEFSEFVETIREDVDASSTDLDAFVKRGGKLMIVSGLVDRIVPSETARDYCEALAKRYGGADRIAPFFRAYFLPGRGHTKAETADGVEDIPSAAAMVEWVERGKVPGPQRGRQKNGGSLTVAPWDGTVACARESGSSFSREAFQKYIDSGEIPGVITVFSKDGHEETACLGYANVEEKRPMSLDGVFQQCSQTKGFCGVTAAILAEEGKLDLDAPVSKYLPEFVEQWVEVSNTNGVRRLEKAKGVPTVRMCLSHTSGLPFELPNYQRMGGWSRRMPLRSAAAVAASLPLKFEPGTGVQYSNIGIDVAAAIVEVVTGMRWEDFLAKRVLEPLGMRDSGFKPTEEQLSRRIDIYTVKSGEKAKRVDAMESMQRPFSDDRVFASSGAGLWTTARDQLKFYRMLMNLGLGENGVRILKEETVKSLLARSQRPKELGDGGYSLGLVAPYEDGEDEWFGHGGAWVSQCLVNWHRKELRMLVVQFDGGYEFRDVCAAAANRFFEHKVDDSGVNAYTGRMK